MKSKLIVTGLVLSYQTAGDFARWNPHFHGLLLEGGFDEQGNFVYLPISSTQQMTEFFRRLVIKHFVDKKLINNDFAHKLLSWKNSGFSIDNRVRIYGSDDMAKESLPETQECSVNYKKQKSTWARLIKKVYGTDPLVCPCCGSEMKIIPIIMDQEETARILKHLVKIGRHPPHFDSASLN